MADGGQYYYQSHQGELQAAGGAAAAPAQQSFDAGAAPNGIANGIPAVYGQSQPFGTQPVFGNPVAQAAPAQPAYAAAEPAQQVNPLATNFTIGIPGGFVFTQHAHDNPISPMGVVSPYKKDSPGYGYFGASATPADAPPYSTPYTPAVTRDAGLKKKQKKSGGCLCC